MAKVNQIYQLVNDAATAAIGSEAFTKVVDTSTLVSLGDTVLSSTANVDAFYKALTDRIGKTVIAGRVWKIKNRSVKRDEMDWGCIYQKISIKKHNAVANPSWDNSAQASPYDIEIQSELVQKLFTVTGTFSFEDSIPQYQLYSAFTNANAMDAVISLIYLNMDNELTLADADLANLAVNTNIAGVLLNGRTSQVRHLLTEYKTLKGGLLGDETTAETVLSDAEFLKYASREINTVVTNMSTPSTVYNSDGIVRETSDENMVVEILGQFASATASYLESDTYHNELVALPRYEKVAYWQAPGESFAFGDVSSIKVSNVSLAIGKQTKTEVDQKYIVGFVHDIDSCASIITRRRDYSKFNERSERMNIMMKADTGYAVDLSENAVVFVLD